jgi:hypothetical protein
MSRKDQLEELIKKRIENLNKDKKPTPPEKPVNTPESDLDLDEGVDKGKGSGKPEKGKRKRNRDVKGYVKRRVK